MMFARLQSRQTAMFPLGLGYIAAVLEGEGYEVSLLDCPSEGYNTLQDIGKDRYVYGLSPDEIRRRIAQFQPHAIGLSCLFSTMERRMRMVAMIAKEVDPNIVVVCGGPHVSACCERLIQDPAIDYCVIGEGEETIVSLLHAMKAGGSIQGIDGLCYRRDGHAVVQPRRQWISNLDDLPLPARHLADMELYFRISEPQGLRFDGERRVRVVQITTSRGCPFQCTYCGKGVTWGASFRARSADNVLNELEYLIEQYHAEHFAIQDDNFSADVQRAAAICDGIVRRGFKVSWEAPNGLAIRHLSVPLLEKMKASGCVSLTIAVESASESVLRRVRKPNYVDVAPSLVAKAKQLGIEVRGFFMIGFPGETLEDVQRTADYARSLKLAVANFAIVTPLPGSELYSECVSLGMIDESTLDFEDLTYGGFDLQLSQVPVEKLKAIRKIEWMRTIFLDDAGNFRHDIRLKRKDVMEELAKGMVLFPDNADIGRMYAQAEAVYADLERVQVGSDGAGSLS
jgi:anaerobic magnesium-protoporphyrin IX monomethyl ester cyclase